MTHLHVPKVLCCFSLILAGGLCYAQNPPGGPDWSNPGGPAAAGAQTPGQDPEPIARPEAEEQEPAASEQPRAAMSSGANPAYQPPPYGLPAVLTVKPGTFVTIRVNEALYSDRSRPGDTFSGTLAQPLVVDGVVVAQRGQMIYGTVAEAAKAHADTPSRLGLALSELTLVDGTQAPVRSELAAFQGGRTPARDQAGTVIQTTAIGAMVGAAAGWGTGAAIGGGIGAAAGGVAVLLTRNKPTVIYPEAALTFRVDAPVEISTARAPQAFQFVNPNDYNRPQELQASAARRRPVDRPPVLYAPYPGWGYPYYYGPGFGVVISHGRRWR